MKGYTIERRSIPSSAGNMNILILRPTENKKSPEETPAVLWIHGGGYVSGFSWMVLWSRAARLVKQYGAVVISPEYRLAGKAPYPAALEDCYTALLYLKEHATEFGCCPDRIMVGGESAGGGLTASLCVYARDWSKVKIAFQMPLYPMIDDQDTDSSRHNHAFPWNTRRNHAAWKRYLADVTGDTPPYAAPARLKDYSSLPPAYTFVGSKEPFYCETLSYIENMQKAGVPAHVDVYPTSFHAFDMLLPFLKMSRRAIEEFEKQYLYAAEHYIAKQDQ